MAPQLSPDSDLILSCWWKNNSTTYTITYTTTTNIHSGSSGGWEERTKLRDKVTLKFTSPTLPIMPIAVKIKLMKLGS